MGSHNAPMVCVNLCQLVLTLYQPMTHSYMRHGCSHFFHKVMGIYMGDLTLDADTLYVDICFFNISHFLQP